MNTVSVSTAFTTNRVAETRDFYVKHFQAKVAFDCGWYVSLEFGSSGSSIQFMSPQKPEHKLSSSAGLTYNIRVTDVDDAYRRLLAEGLPAVIPLEDHPWGDRGFGVQDPNGITLYLYQETEPSEEFKQYFK